VASKPKPRQWEFFGTVNLPACRQFDVAGRRLKIFDNREKGWLDGTLEQQNFLAIQGIALEVATSGE
jgi:hypothetical protein